MIARAHRTLRRCLLWLVLPALGGGSAAAETPVIRWGLPESVSAVGGRIDHLFYVILWITGGVFVLVEATLLVFLIRYRQRPGRKAAYTHGDTRIEIIWTVVPAIIMVWLALTSQQLWSEVRSPGRFPAGAMEVVVTGEQFAWNFRYPGADGRLGTADDDTTLNQLHPPVGQPVIVRLKPKDGIHSFFLPQFRMKQDAVPGMTGRIWLQAAKTGHWEIACAELCGLGHYRMKGFLTVETPEELAQWLAATKAAE